MEWIHIVVSSLLAVLVAMDVILGRKLANRIEGFLRQEKEDAGASDERMRDRWEREYMDSVMNTVSMKARKVYAETHGQERRVIEKTGGMEHQITGRHVYSVIDYHYGNLSYNQFKNREMADEHFSGFNLQIHDNSDISLTFRGHTLVTLEHSKNPDIGKEKRCDDCYTIILYPPSVEFPMSKKECEILLLSYDILRECEGNPQMVFEWMIHIFSSDYNAMMLKYNIEPRMLY